MNDHITIGLILLILIGSALSLLHQFVFRPMLHDLARFGVFAIRDELRRSAIDGEIQRSSPSYTYLESMLNRMVHYCGWFSVAALFEYVFLRGKLSQSPVETQNFESQSKPWMRTLERKAHFAMVPALIANSPGWAIIVFGLTSKAWLQRQIMKAREFWHAPSSWLSSAMPEFTR